MENFLTRSISNESEEYDIKVHRMRTTNGFASISIEHKKQKIEFTNEDDNDDYEKEALELAKLLKNIAMNPCTLPKIEE